MDHNPPIKDNSTPSDGESDGDLFGQTPTADTSADDARIRDAEEKEEEEEKAALRERIESAVAEFQRGVDRERNFRILFDTYYESVRQFLARKRISSPEDRLDLTQETFLKVYKGLKGYRGEAQFGTWVFRIASNTHLKWLRRARIDGQGSDAGMSTEEHEGAWDDDQRIAVSTEESPLDRTLRTERRMALRRAIAELPEQMRRCTELRIYHDLSYREIAVVMRLSIDTVKVHLFQARKKLKASFGDVQL